MPTLLLALAIVTSAAAPADVNQYIKVSGVTVQLSHTPALVLSGFEDAVAKNAVRGDPQHIAGLRAAIPEVYAPTRMMAIVREQLIKTLDAAALRKTLDWYKGPLAQKVTALKVVVSSFEGMTALQRPRA